MREQTLAKNYAREAPGIFALQFYEAENCLTLVESLRRSRGWAEAEVAALRPARAGRASLVRTRWRRASISALPPRARSARDFRERMDGLVKPLVREIWRVNLPEHTAPQVVRYVPGNYYRIHNDTDPDRPERYFTLICYLNDDFTGGRTSFPTLKMAVRPRAGKAILFPSTYLHCAEPVIRGEKYVLVSWLMGPTPIKWV